MAELVLPDPCVVLLIGAAGSGKSTFAARHFPADAILSSDELRAAIAGDAADQAATKPAFAALHRALERRLASGRLTVVDATNVRAAARNQIRRRAARHGVPVVAVVFNLPPDLIRARNATRPGRIVPSWVVDEHLDEVAGALARGRLESEGYAGLVVLRSTAEVDGLVIRLEPATATPASTSPPASPG